MTQEEKQELLVALCGYLPYETIICRNNGKTELLDPLTLTWNELPKPYLRPMTSMTDDEKKELCLFGIEDIYDGFVDFGEFLGEGSPIKINHIADFINWLNKNKFDYRNLISCGLALPAPEDMYNN